VNADSERERLARVLLCRVAEPGETGLAQRVARDGAVDTVEWLLSLPPTTPQRRNWDERIPSASPERDLAAGRAVGARFVIPGDAEWPDQLADIAMLAAEHAAIPFGLWVRGDLDLRAACARSVAVVGARASTAYGEYVASEFAFGLVERGWAVVSGGAYGIDGAAHRGALGASGVTVAVLACGVDVAYPRGHTALIDRVASTGLVISEWPPGCAPMRHRFLVRNRVIAAITKGTVVVEAAIRSGSLSTANRAAGMLRHVMSVPGPITSTMSAGTNALLKQPEVACVTGAADVIEVVGEIGADLAPLPDKPVDARDKLDPTTRRVLEAVPVRAAAGAARIARTAGIDVVQVGRSLGRLAANGFVENVDGGWRLSRR
jgi:DNA processing protein